MDPSDIVEQLRSVDGTKDAGFVIDLCWEAAAEITRLRGLLRQAHGVIDHAQPAINEIQSLRAALANAKAEERERCARVAEEKWPENVLWSICGKEIAAEIRKLAI